MTATTTERQITAPETSERRRTIARLVREWDTAMTVRDLFHDARAEAERQLGAGHTLGHQRILPDLDASAAAAEEAARRVAEALRQAQPRSLTEMAEKLRVLTASFGDGEHRISETRLWDDVLADLRNIAAGEAVRLAS